MKIKIDFVTNSSSSSFIIPLVELSAKQLADIMNYEDHVKGADYSYHWKLEIIEDTLRGYTSMDNFSMYEHMAALGIDVDLAEWSD